MSLTSLVLVCSSKYRYAYNSPSEPDSLIFGCKEILVRFRLYEHILFKRNLWLLARIYIIFLPSQNLIHLLHVYRFLRMPDTIFVNDQSTWEPLFYTVISWHSTRHSAAWVPLVSGSIHHCSNNNWSSHASWTDIILKWLLQKRIRRNSKRM
jgi:hypothetical protein